MTDMPIVPPSYEQLMANIAALKARTAAERGITPEPASVPEPPPPPTFTSVGLEDLDIGDMPSDAAKQVNDACDTLDIVEVYKRVSKNRWERPYQGELREGIKISCPNLAHPDNIPSAWINTILGLWACVACDDGGDKYVVAARAWAMDFRRDLFKIKCRLAKELRGIDYDALKKPVVMHYREALISSIRGGTNE